MLILSEDNLAGYIQEYLLEKMGLTSNTLIKDVAVAGGKIAAVAPDRAVTRSRLTNDSAMVNTWSAGSVGSLE